MQTFDAVDTTLHVALHACFAGADRLGWLVDLDRVVRAMTPDCDELVRRAETWSAGLPVGLAALRARDTSAWVGGGVVSTGVAVRSLEAMTSTIALTAPSWRLRDTPTTT